MNMNVRRWKFNFTDNEGNRRFDFIKAMSKKHVMAIIKSRCKSGYKIKSLFPDGDRQSARYARPLGRVRLVCWEGLTSPEIR